ncbi:general odorant-binding protein 56d-like [Drosophila innubila]|uniref:general odorant-binding protein 56d-like n=1 Tax=Drosophila innubila TaxID=198719 RepID=UPI00148E10E0|nr:general odorant-binding protein 56d-like [Drosophila innubila]
MKFLFVLVTYLAFAGAVDDLHLDRYISKERSDKLKGFLNECHTTHNITKQQLIIIVNGNFEDADTTLKCFVSCYYEKLALLDDQKQPDLMLDGKNPVFDAELVKSSQNNCSSITGSDNCDTALKVYECYYKIADKIFSFQHVKITNDTISLVTNSTS